MDAHDRGAGLTTKVRVSKGECSGLTRKERHNGRQHGRHAKLKVACKHRRGRVCNQAELAPRSEGVQKTLLSKHFLSVEHDKVVVGEWEVLAQGVILH